MLRNRVAEKCFKSKKDEIKETLRAASILQFNNQLEWLKHVVKKQR